MLNQQVKTSAVVSLIGESQPKIVKPSPTFLHPNIKVRTSEGWVAIKDFRQGEILCFNNETKKTYWAKPKGTSKYTFYYGDMNMLSWPTGTIPLKPSTKCLTSDFALTNKPKELYSLVSKNMDVDIVPYSYGDALFSIDFDTQHIISVLYDRDYIFIQV